MDTTKSKKLKEPTQPPPSAVDEALDPIYRNHYPETFTGEVHTFVYKPHNGFANFAIARLTIQDGVVKAVTLSDPYAGFEAISRMDILSNKAMEALRGSYPAGYRRHV